MYLGSVVEIASSQSSKLKEDVMDPLGAVAQVNMMTVMMKVPHSIAIIC